MQNSRVNRRILRRASRILRTPASRILHASFVTAATLLAAGTAHAGSLSQAVASRGSITGSATAAVTAAQQQAATLAQQSQQNLSQVLAAFKAAQTVQAAARAAAATAGTNGVTDGLSSGGLVVDPRVTAGTDPNLWINAGAPVQNVANGQTTVTIQQTAQNAVMTWQQFNVGMDTTVYFNQSGGNSSNGNNWIALNRIDATGVPSQILGQIKAEGTVMLINPNGIVFNGTSQVNVHSLIAAAMDINSYTGASPNVGALGSNGTYVPVTVGGSPVTVSGVPVMAPPQEDNANQAFLANGLYANGIVGTNGGGTMLLTVGIVPNGASFQANQGIVVQPGASIAANVNGFDNGGTVMLLGPSVSNGGAISTSAGQIVLAASSSLWLTEPQAIGSNGTIVSVVPYTNQNSGTPGTYNVFPVPSGAVTVNGTSGLLTSSRGNITLVGDEVEQLGVVQATTSITRAGSITINASGTPTASSPDMGLLLFGSGSVTAIIPDENGETIPTSSASTFVAPSITANAWNLDMQGTAAGQPGALVVAPGATMNVSTSTAFNNANPTTSPVGRALLESGSVIDLAGLDATASVTDNLYTFKVTANDVADTPLAQNLIGMEVTIDLSQSGVRADGEAWVGSPLFASSGAGYLSDIPRSLDQLLTKGGTLNFNGTSGGYQPFLDVIQVPGSSVDISGGAITFAGGMITTTQLLGSDGRSYNIGAANPLISYTGLAGQYTVSHPHWGVTETYANPLITRGYYDPGYVDGISAGSLSVTAANPILEGTIAGSVLLGSQQALQAQADTGANGTQAIPNQLPIGASLAINASPTAFGAADILVLQGDAPDVLGSGFGMTSVLSLPTQTLRAALGTGSGTIVTDPVLSLSTDILSAAGFSSISISSASALSMDSGAVLSVLPGGSIKLSGVTEIDGTLRANSGSISLTGYTGGTTPLTVPPVSAVTIGSGALLDVSGLWVDDAGVPGDAVQGPARINGGSVTIQTYLHSATATGTVTDSGPNGTINVPFADMTQSIVLAAGSVIDLSSGGYVGANGKIKAAADGLPAGNGGSLSLLTYVSNPGNSNAGWSNPLFQYGNNYSFPSTGNIAPSGIDPVTGLPEAPDRADVVMNGTIYSGALNQGGTFTLQAPSIQVGGVSAITDFAAAGTQGGGMALPASFFSGNGFSSYVLTSTYGSTTVTPGTTVVLQQQNYLPALAALPATGAVLRDFAATGLAPAGERPAAGLTLAETPYDFGGTLFGDGSNDPSVNAGVLVGAGAAIVGDPKAAITLTAAGPVIVLGRLAAPGGSITLSSTGAPSTPSQLSGGNASGTTQAPLDVWIGPGAVLDVGGTFVPNPLVTAYSTGTALPGGTITITGGTIVALPGSAFDLAGAAGTVEFPAVLGGLTGGQFAPQEVWSNGGTLALNGSATPVPGLAGQYQTLYFDGTIDAAGGAPLAAGGTLTIGGVPTPSYYTEIIIPGSGPVTGLLNTGALAGSAPASMTQLQNLLPNTNPYAYISAATLDGSGFDTVNLMAPVAFSGNVTVQEPGTLVIGGNVTLLPSGNVNPTFTAASIGATTVSLNAGYVILASPTTTAAPTLSDGTLDVNGSVQVDLAGGMSISNASNVNITSGGDIRLVAETDPEFFSGAFRSSNSYFFSSATTYYSATAQAALSIVQSPGELVVPDNLTLTAREVYPTTDAAFLLTSTGRDPGGNAAGVNTIAIRSNGQTPTTPFSVDGTVLVDAIRIDQDGALYAPLGEIELGLTGGALPVPWSSANFFTKPAVVVTQSVSLDPGSITSVSLDGLDLPYGFTTNDINWSAVDPLISTGFGSGAAYPYLTAPPLKAILLNGATVDSQAGATVDLSGGGDIYATEFVPGTGGSRNVLTTAGSGQTVYALVPGYAGNAAASDAVYGQAVAVGTTVTLPGGDGIAAGTYTLMPASYATLPGAYRVVVASTNANPATPLSVAADGSIMMAGTLGNAVDGTRSSQTALLEIQSNAVWTKYSQIDITSGNTYFAGLAKTAGTVAPPLPADGGSLTVAATASLNIQSAYDFAPAAGGRGGQAAITGTNILVLAPDQTPPAADSGYIVLNPDQLDALGATTLLLGGTSVLGTGGDTITATAHSLEIETDAAHPLTAPDLLLVTLASASSEGLTVDAGSVIEALGAVPAGTDVPITIGAGTAATSSGSLLRVSNGAPVTITRTAATATNASLTIGTTPGTATLAPSSAAVTIDGGVALTLDSSGGNVVAANTVLQAQNDVLSGSVVDFGDVPPGTPGLIVSSSLLAALAGADSVTLKSASVFDFYDLGGLSVGTASSPVGSLTLDGAGLYGDGGTTTIYANSLELIDSQTAPSTANALAASGGTLAVVAGTVTFDAGTKTLGNFGQVNIGASQQIVFAGTGSTGAGGSAVALSAPAVVAGAGSAQSLTTTGLLQITPGTGTAPTVAPTTLGGSLTLSGGTVDDSGTIVALGGQAILTATTGNLTLDAGAVIDATGSHILLFDATEDAPAGRVQLTATSGNVTVSSGAMIDVSSTGIGYAGTVTISASNGTATLDGTLAGGAAYNDLGGEFILTSGTLSGSLPLTAGFTRGFAVTLGQGDITIAAGQTLTSGDIVLTANGGSVVVNGTLDASAPNGGLISLYGAGTTNGTTTTGGVTIGGTARLLATYRADDPNDPANGNGESALVQNGGTITLGTTGTPDGNYNADYGYEEVQGANAGTISVASGALFDVSGGAGGSNISNNGGAIDIRAPILAGGNVNVSFSGTVRSSDNGGPAGGGLSLDAYAVWSTTDGSGTGKHFDGIIDPAGWYNPDGTEIAGTTATGSDIFTPTGAVDAAHVTFYQTTLVDFVQDPFGGNATAVAADFAGASGVALGATLHLAPEIDLINPSTGFNSGNITVASNWNLGAGNVVGGVYTPYYRTTGVVDPGEAGVLALRAANNVQINATISDGFYATFDPFYEMTTAALDPSNGAGLAANQIANNPQVATNAAWGATSINDDNTTTVASLMSIVAGVNDGSFSYDIVAGAAGASGTPAANPNAVIAVPSTVTTVGTAAQDSVLLDGFVSYASSQMAASGRSGAIDIPTVVRTGTGSITIDAAGSFEIVNNNAPGAVYTAGALAPNAADFTPPTMAGPNQYTALQHADSTGLVSTPQWARNGGAVTIVAGSDIVGVETPVDTGGVQTGTANASTAEFWGSWYFTAGLSSGEAIDPFDTSWNLGRSNNLSNVPAQQNATWINYATFAQGVGALGGGNITLTAGLDIDDISASLPETIQVSGGQSLADAAPAAHYYGGGDLVVQAGRNLYSSTFYVGRGTGTIQAGGIVAADPANPITGLATGFAPEQNNTGSHDEPRILVATPAPLPLLLAEQDGFISVNAASSVAVGGVFDPATLPSGINLVGQKLNIFQPLPSDLISILPASFGLPFSTYGQNSGLSVVAASGNVALETLGTLSGFITELWLRLGGAASTTNYAPELPATVEADAILGNISFATSTASTTPTTGTAAPIAFNVMPSSDGTIDLLAGGSISTLFVGAHSGASVQPLTMLDGTSISLPPSLLGQPTPTQLPAPLHADDDTPVVIYAGGNISPMTVNLIKPAEIEAGNDIANVTFSGQNNNPDDITSLIAGVDILAQPMKVTVGTTTGIVNGVSNFQLYGPGTLLVEAGRNIGPFFSTTAAPGATAAPTGIETVGNGSSMSQFAKGGVVSYLPVGGANAYILFGVGGGVDYGTAIADYVNPASAGAGGIDYLADIAVQLGQPRDQAWATFQGLSSLQQQVLVDRAFLDFLAQVGVEYNDTASPYYHEYARAYATIATLFPATQGYTNNAPTGMNGAAATVHTGDLSMAHSLLETQAGGDIGLIGPGGNVIVGANATDNSSPSQEGILTLQGGSILGYADESVEVYQSRIFTEQGGDVDLFSANGDLNAGKGPKSSASYPRLTLIWDKNGYARVNPSGLVTGAGIGALLSIPGQDPALSNAALIAPRGTIDADAAGIRVAGNAVFDAAHILNAFNITVGGTATGIPVAVAPNIGALTTASNTAGAASAAADEAARNSRQTGPRNNDLPSIITFEVIGYGGGDGAPSDQEKQRSNTRKKGDDQSLNGPNGNPVSPYRTTSAVQILGSGALTSEESQYLTQQEKRVLSQPFAHE